MLARLCMEPVAPPRRLISSSREHQSETLEVQMLKIVPSLYPEKLASDSLNTELTCFKSLFQCTVFILPMSYTAQNVKKTKIFFSHPHVILNQCDFLKNCFIEECVGSFSHNER